MNIGSRILDVFAKISDSLRRISLEKKMQKYISKKIIIGSSDSFTNLVFTNPPIFPQKFAVCLDLLQAYFCLRIINIIQKKTRQNIHLFLSKKAKTFHEKPDERYKIRKSV